MTVDLPAGCVVEANVEEPDEVRVVVRAEAATCDRVDVVLPPGVAVARASGKERRSDDTKLKLDPVRFERTPRAVDGSGRLRVHLPDLLAGDRVELELELVRSEPWSGAPLWPPGDVTIEERLALVVPQGDPQVRLYPGGGSSVTVERRLVFAASEHHRAWPLEAPVGADVRLATEPKDAAELVRDAGGWRLVVLPSEGATRATVAWDEPDAPTYGERAPDVARLVVDAPGGEVRWDGDAWTLVGINDRVVLPSREMLVAALDARFRAAALPEPGAPMELRGRDPNEELAAQLRPTVARRAPVGDWPADPLWPRKLGEARSSGALSPVEAALVVWLYGRQLRLETDWAIARPASAGPASGPSPAGYTAPLVRVRIGGVERWIDPTCGVCAPFELPPDLEGASALGRGLDATPPPTPGRSAARIGLDRVEWTVTGPPALLLRRWIALLPEAERTSALAGAVGGPGARLVEVVGLEKAGEPVRVVTSLADGVRIDPLALPVPREDVWVEWIGERRLERAATAADGPATFEQGPLSWTRTVADGLVTEVLRVADRTVPGDAVRALDAARAAPPPTPSPVPAPP